MLQNLSIIAFLFLATTLTAYGMQILDHTLDLLETIIIAYNFAPLFLFWNNQ